MATRKRSGKKKATKKKSGKKKATKKKVAKRGARHSLTGGSPIIIDG